MLIAPLSREVAAQVSRMIVLQNVSPLDHRANGTLPPQIPLNVCRQFLTRSTEWSIIQEASWAKAYRAADNVQQCSRAALF
jgi:hypothetical protein